MATPQGLSGQAAISLVRLYANEPNLPTDTNLLTFLNRCVEEVDRRIGGIRLWGQYPTVNMQTYIMLNDDVMDITGANFSMGNAAYNSTGSSSPLAQGALVYPMESLTQAQFFDAASGFPAVGFGPPQAYFIYQDQGTAPGTTLPVPPTPTLFSVAGTSSGALVEVVTTYVNTNGETTASAAADFTPTTTQQTAVASPNAVTNATGYNTYAGAQGGPYYKQNGSTPTALGTPFTIPNPVIGSGTQPPGTNTATGSGTGGAMTMQLYPAAITGQVNIYYRARPTLWSSTSSGTDFTNLDTSAQEAVVLLATVRVLQHRERAAEAKAIWQPEYEAMIASLTESINRRTQPKSGRVRDVRDRSFPSAPFWMTSP